MLERRRRAARRRRRARADGRHLGRAAGRRSPPSGREPRPGLFLYRVDERRFVEGGALSDGGNLHAWLERTLRLPESPSPREPDAHGLTFLPLLGGERSPGWNGRAHGAIAGLTFETTPTDILQAALEGVACRFRELADRARRLDEVVATGGALHANPDWVQIVADVLERPVGSRRYRRRRARGAAVADARAARQDSRRAVAAGARSSRAGKPRRRTVRRASASAISIEE